MGLWDWDLVTGELVWDERSAEMYGTTLAESTGSISDVERLVHPDDLAHVNRALSGAIDTAGAVDVEFRVRWPDQSIHWLYGRGQAITDEAGTVVRLIGANLDITRVRAEAERQAADARRMARLVAVAQAMAAAVSETDIMQIVTGRGVAAIGAQGAVLVVRTPDSPQLTVLRDAFFDEDYSVQFSHLPSDFPSPGADSALTGRSHFLASRAEALREFPGAAGMYERGNMEATASLPLHEGDSVFGSLSVVYDTFHEWREADRELLEVLTALTAQALVRVYARESQARSAAVITRLAESLQRSLLADPPRPNDLHIAVRYRPAVHHAQIGGDWYDAFRTAEDSTTVIIGDVAGHDEDAAAVMAQLRNILRGVAQSTDQAPAGVLSTLEKALDGLGLDTLATAVLCRVSRINPATGMRTLHWSNAGHPPPLAIFPGGAPVLLTTPPDLLIGLDHTELRQDHMLELPRGTRLVLFTDGLIERRGESLDKGLERLTQMATEWGELATEEICDRLLASLGEQPEDDIALVALQA